MVELRTDDRVIAVGDLIVKGPQNRQVLDRFIEDDRFSSVIGNHDRALRQYWRGEPLQLNKQQRVTAAELESQRERYSAYLRSLPFAINLGSHLVVHAGIRPGVPLKRQMASDLTEMRTIGANPSSRRGLPWYDVYRGKRIVLFGHWPAKAPRLAPRAHQPAQGTPNGRSASAFTSRPSDAPATSRGDRRCPVPAPRRSRPALHRPDR